MNKNLIYGIVGDGRVASHMVEYLTLEKLKYIIWSRKNDSETVADKLSAADIILILISDKNITDFFNKNTKIKNKILVHFSGSFSSEEIYGVHPLMTFGTKMYDLETYRSIPFIFEESVPFSELFPVLKNRSYPIKVNKKGLYHALCVLGGNFSIILWQKVKKEFEEKLNLPWEILLPYLKQTFKNIESSCENTLTGPLQRDDTETISNNISSLDEAEWKDVYSAFKKAYRRENSK